MLGCWCDSIRFYSVPFGSIRFDLIGLNWIRLDSILRLAQAALASVLWLWKFSIEFLDCFACARAFGACRFDWQSYDESSSLARCSGNSKRSQPASRVCASEQRSADACKESNGASKDASQSDRKRPKSDRKRPKATEKRPKASEKRPKPPKIPESPEACEPTRRAPATAVRL